MRITHSPSFARALNKLHKNQKLALDQALLELSINPALGEQKRGSLTGIFVFKFRISNTEYLLAYRFQSDDEIRLLVLGPHENFYRDLDR